MVDQVSSERIQELSYEFDDLCQARHDMGSVKYGGDTWLTIDTLEHALAEIVDMGNYIRYTYIKLRLLQEHLGGDGSIAELVPGNEMMGKPPVTGVGLGGFFNPYGRDDAHRTDSA